MRVGERTDFDRLRFFLETDGTIDPEDAFIESAKTLVAQFAELTTLKPESAVILPTENTETESAEEEKGDDALKTKIAELDLPTRVAHALEEAGIKSVGGLIRKTESDILALEGMGDKGVSDIKKTLKKLGVTLKEE